MGNINKRLLIAFLIAALLFTFSQAYAYTEITDCTTITSPGEYRLVNDINSASSVCILIQADNVILDCQYHTITGTGSQSYYGIYVDSRKNVEIRNCVVNGWSIGGVYLYSSTGCILENITSINSGIFLDTSNQNILNNVSSTGYSNGIVLASSNNNTITNSQFYSNSYAGITFRGSNNNTISNSRIYNNSLYGAKIIGSNYNTIINSVFSNNYYNIYTDSDENVFDNLTVENGYEGVDIEGANNVLRNSIIRNNGCGLYLYLDYSINNLIYNNIFNNSNNFCYDIFAVPHSNYFNVTLTPKTNIVGGPYIGGNYWGSPDGTGYSDTCVDSNYDGICDSPYTLTSNGPNIDYLPLARYVGPYCGNGVCESGEDYNTCPADCPIPPSTTTSTTTTTTIPSYGLGATARAIAQINPFAVLIFVLMPVIIGEAVINAFEEIKVNEPLKAAIRLLILIISLALFAAIF